LLLGVLTLAGWITPTALLGLTFALGLGAALNSPAWQAILPEIVGRRQLHDAVALNSIGFNLARAVGPAVGGLVVSLAGPSPAFFLNAAAFLATIGAIAWWRPAASTPTGVAESLLGATRAGLRYARFAPALVAVL